MSAKMSPQDLARWRGQQHRANQMRREDVQLPLLRLVELPRGETPYVVDEIVSVHPAQLGWTVVEADFADEDDPSGEPVLAWAIGRERVWPITVGHNAEHWATEAGWALLAPDGRVYDGVFSYEGIAQWLSVERPALNVAADPAKRDADHVAAPASKSTT